MLTKTIRPDKLEKNNLELFLGKELRWVSVIFHEEVIAEDSVLCGRGVLEEEINII